LKSLFEKGELKGNLKKTIPQIERGGGRINPVFV
jgi:hypothetical protein